MLFGDKIRELREQAGMTQAELGKKIGVSDRVLGYYESNERFPKKQEVLVNLASVFKVSIDYLLEADGKLLKDANDMYGTTGYKQAQEILKSAETLFAGGQLLEEYKDDFFRTLTELYFDSKQKNKTKFGIKKDK